jgi:hypothetical protein
VNTGVQTQDAEHLPEYTTNAKSGLARRLTTTHASRSVVAPERMFTFGGGTLVSEDRAPSGGGIIVRPRQGLAHAWRMLGACLAHAWRMLGACLAHAWRLRPYQRGVGT